MSKQNSNNKKKSGNLGSLDMASSYHPKTFIVPNQILEPIFRYIPDRDTV